MNNNGETVFHSSNSGVINTNVDNKINIPNNYKPLSAWAYFGYSFLFTLPLIGFILLIVFSFNNSNINRRNFARSYWCSLLVAVIIIVVMVILFFALGIKIDINNFSLPTNI